MTCRFILQKHNFSFLIVYCLLLYFYFKIQQFHISQISCKLFMWYMWHIKCLLCFLKFVSCCIVMVFTTSKEKAYLFVLDCITFIYLFIYFASILKFTLQTDNFSSYAVMLFSVPGISKIWNYLVVECLTFLNGVGTFLQLKKKKKKKIRYMIFL